MIPAKSQRDARGRWLPGNTIRKERGIPPGVTVRELAQAAGCTRGNVYLWLRAGRVEGYRLGGRTFITVESINRNLIRPCRPRQAKGARMNANPRRNAYTLTSATITSGAIPEGERRPLHGKVAR